MGYLEQNSCILEFILSDAILTSLSIMTETSKLNEPNEDYDGSGQKCHNIKFSEERWQW